MRVLVVTVVHNPADARILHRQISALVERGHDVSYAAPFHAFGVSPPLEIDVIDLPQALERHRVAAWRRARSILAEQGIHHDVILLHDPELLLALPGLRHRWERSGSRPVVVWDVHEDTAAALSMKRYVPSPLRAPLRGVVHSIERLAEQRLRLLLAEESYQNRFRQPHPIVPNFTTVPPGPPMQPGSDRVVYVGHLSQARGALDLIEVAKGLPKGIRLEVIGEADRHVRGALAEADREGLLRWHGFIPNDQALPMLRGALAGISLLHDEPNYRHSRHTKLVEYMAYGLPVITTPNPSAAEIVDRYRCGLVVPFDTPRAACDAIKRLQRQSELRTQLGTRAYEAAARSLNWSLCAGAFVAQLETWTAHPPPDGAHWPSTADDDRLGSSASFAA